MEMKYTKTHRKEEMHLSQEIKLNYLLKNFSVPFYVFPILSIIDHSLKRLDSKKVKTGLKTIKLDREI